MAREKIQNAQQAGAYGSGTPMFGTNINSYSALYYYPGSDIWRCSDDSSSLRVEVQKEKQRAKLPNTFLSLTLTNLVRTRCLLTPILGVQVLSLIWNFIHILTRRGNNIL